MEHSEYKLLDKVDEKEKEYNKEIVSSICIMWNILMDHFNIIFILVLLIIS